ncbi:hypothetical protein Ddye_017106 [Dipteronia dyeriana]|uniref:Uncharacterized protein n=1 Tax=Dipteronia dyeriana TaxID=168575 RepID=A0AAD9U8X1_9ROSI|nr:hypothetical protein Ddye_017106 [Dipteronia dyeriana]
MAKHLVLLSLAVVLLTFSCLAFAYEPSPLQDFCVADTTSSARVNGIVCNDPMKVQADDFFFSGLHIAGNTSNAVGSSIKPVNVAQIPGSTLLACQWCALTLLPGASILLTPTLEPARSLPYLKALLKWDLLPQSRRIASSLNQNPGAITIANVVVGSNPSIGSDILAKAFQVDKKIGL